MDRGVLSHQPWNRDVQVANAGTRVTIWEEPLTDRPSGLANLSEGGRTMRVLIVEDEFLIASLLEAIVEEQGHEQLGPVSTVEQALAYAPRADIALVDLGLADGNRGVSSCTAARRPVRHRGHFRHRRCKRSSGRI